MRELDKTSIAVVLVGIGAWITGTLLLANVSSNSSDWLISMLAAMAIVGPGLIVLGVLGFIISAALVDRRDDELHVHEESQREAKLSEVLNRQSDNGG